MEEGRTDTNTDFKQVIYGLTPRGEFEGERVLIVRLDQIPDHKGLDLDCAIEPAALALDDDPDHVEILEAVSFMGKIARAGNDVYLTGAARGLVALRCSRCLEDFAFPLKCHLDVHYIPSPDQLPEEIELEAEELDESTYQGEEIDITPEIRDQLLLSLPLKPLCKEDCLGLCPKCGANLNLERCDCTVEKRDHRFDALKGWKVQHEPAKEN